jgi:hypothetical protein
MTMIRRPHNVRHAEHRLSSSGRGAHVAMSFDPPIFIICRDRLTGLADLVAWLESVGCQRIHLVDNDSAWPPLLEYFEQTPHTVIRTGQNLGNTAVWAHDLPDRYAPGEPFVVSDPDVVPVEECPRDALERFRWLLRRYPDYVKAGFGLVLDDLPEHNGQRDVIVGWESQYWRTKLGRGIYHAPIDTTFALHLPGVPWTLRPAIRTGRPYVARHLGWYTSTADPGDEEIFYRGRADPSIRMWSRDDAAVTTVQAASQAAARSTIEQRMRWWLHVQKEYRYRMWRQGTAVPRWSKTRRDLGDPDRSGAGTGGRSRLTAARRPIGSPSRGGATRLPPGASPPWA